MSIPKLSTIEMETLMKEALVDADKASMLGEVPIGAIIWHNGTILARAHNECENQHSATAHAECLAIERASKVLNNWRLDECIICVTLEPCTMCIGAIQLARIPLLIFGSFDPRMGAVGSLYDLSNIETVGKIRTVSGICAEECTEKLKKFFKEKRE